METKQKLKVGDKILCIKKYHEDITIDNTYKIDNINNDYFLFYDDAGDCIPCKLESFNEFFKLKEETAYKETEGKLFYELDFEFITQMAERMASNKKEGKYGLFNWMKPMSKTDLINLIQAQYRHAMDLMNFKFEDDGRPYGTLEAFSNNAMMINYQLKTYFKYYEFSKEDLLELSNKEKGNFKGIISNFKEENEFKNGDKFKFKDKNEQYVFIGKVNDLWFGKPCELAIYRKDNNISSTMLQPYKDFIKEIQVSPSTKINTIDSTGLLTEE